jgi:hypothetical protein
MSEQWRDRYDSWKLAPGNTVYGTGAEGPGRYSDETAESLGLLDEDGEPVDQDALDAQAEDAAVERAERQREDAMFDAPEREERVCYE